MNDIDIEIEEVENFEQDASLQLMRKCVTFFDNVSPCTP